MAKDDPLHLEGLDPAVIEEQKSKAKIKPLNEIDKLREERLQSKEERLKKEKTQQQGKQTPAAAPQVSAEAISNKLDKISAYRERFPNLKSRNAKVSSKSTVEEIEDELHYIELQLGSSADGSLGQKLFIFGLGACESLTQTFNPLNLQLSGLSRVAQDNIAEISPIIDELMIKYSCGTYMPPEWRLAFATGALMYTVHQANTGNMNVAEAMHKMHQQANVPSSSKDL